MRFVFASEIAAPATTVFLFHEQPQAFRWLLPPWERAEILRSVQSLQAGERALVRLRLLPGVWLTWEALHTVYDPPHRFEDVQVRGPFRHWRHSHQVLDLGERARLVDDIEFSLGLGPLDRLVLPRLRQTFAYRHRVTEAWCHGRTSGSAVEL